MRRRLSKLPFIKVKWEMELGPLKLHKIARAIPVVNKTRGWPEIFCFFYWSLSRNLTLWTLKITFENYEWNWWCVFVCIFDFLFFLGKMTNSWLWKTYLKSKREKVEVKFIDFSFEGKRLDPNFREKIVLWPVCLSHLRAS